MISRLFLPGFFKFSGPLFTGSNNTPNNYMASFPYRYNTSISNPCDRKKCSHLCVVVNAGGGQINGNQARCTCPDGQRLDLNGKTCDGADEPALALPLVCKCRNGGYCRDDSSCFCLENFSGTYCENEVRRVPTIGDTRATAVVVPVILIAVVLIAATSLYVYWRRQRGL